MGYFGEIAELQDQAAGAGGAEGGVQAAGSSGGFDDDIEGAAVAGPAIEGGLVVGEDGIGDAELCGHVQGFLGEVDGDELMCAGAAGRR